MILQKTLYDNLQLKKHLLLKSILKTVVLHIYVDTVYIFEIVSFSNNVKIFARTFDQLNASLLNKSIKLFKEK